MFICSFISPAEGSLKKKKRERESRHLRFLFWRTGVSGWNKLSPNLPAQWPWWETLPLRPFSIPKKAIIIYVSVPPGKGIKSHWSKIINIYTVTYSEYIQRCISPLLAMFCSMDEFPTLVSVPACLYLLRCMTLGEYMGYIVLFLAGLSQTWFCFSLPTCSFLDLGIFCGQWKYQAPLTNHVS